MIRWTETTSHTSTRHTERGNMFLPILLDWFTELFYPEKTPETIVPRAIVEPNLDEIMKTIKTFSIWLNTAQLTRVRIGNECVNVVTTNNVFTDRPQPGLISVVVATPYQLGFREGDTYPFRTVLNHAFKHGLTTCHVSTQKACGGDIEFGKSNGDILFFARFGENGEVQCGLYSDEGCDVFKIRPREGAMYMVEPDAKIVFEVRM